MIKPEGAEVMSKPVDQVEPTDVVQVVVHGALFPQIVEWLREREFFIEPFPHGPEDLDTYMTGPSQERMRRAAVESAIFGKRDG